MSNVRLREQMSDETNPANLSHIEGYPLEIDSSVGADYMLPPSPSTGIEEREEVPKRFKIDLGFALEISDILRKKMEELDGRMAADRNQGRDSSAMNAAVSKEMLYVAHLAHKIETEILDQYHAFKGEDEHL